MFLDLENAAEKVEGTNKSRSTLETDAEHRVEVYENRVRELEEQLLELRINSMPVSEYKQLMHGVASECESVRKCAVEQVTD